MEKFHQMFRDTITQLHLEEETLNNLKSLPIENYVEEVNKIIFKLNDEFKLNKRQFSVLYFVILTLIESGYQRGKDDSRI